MTHSLRVIFAGTPEFAATALEAIVAAGFPVPLVLTQPDRPAGRGMKLAASAVKRTALEHGIAVAQPPSLRREGKYPAEAAAALDQLNATPHDVMVVAAYGLLLPQEVLDIPPHGCLNIHGSLLPRWRGAAPIHRAIQAGDARTGITIMKMDAGLDTGPMISESAVPIGATDTYTTMHDTLAALGAKLIVEALVELERSGKLDATPQPAEGATYAQKIAKEEAALDWSQSADVLARQIRAFDPFPGAVAQWNGTPLKLWSAQTTDAPTDEFAVAPGTIVSAGAQGVVVACGDGAIRVTELQKPGGKRLPAREFLAGVELRAGQTLSSSES
ncbi:10-formyltetrahydrofolate:L-methionyl-tRNA(fMet) N-formyltransferase [Pararobbsia alpina]|uniref:methionyl-tRNA formyltransferase n=1 Tax=Pararobbsia alpina TaxID=621374 RepID=UPI0039A6D47C